MIYPFKNWLFLANRGIKIVGLEYCTTDRVRILTHFYEWGQNLQLPVLFWNCGYRCFQQVNCQGEGGCRLENTNLQANSDPLLDLLENQTEGIFIIEGILELSGADLTDKQREFQLVNAYYHLSENKHRQFWVLLENNINLPANLQPLIPVLKAPIADRVWVQQKVASFCHDTSPMQEKKDSAIQESLVRACLGLAQGEIELILQQSLAFTNSFEDLADWVLNYKVNKLQGRGLELISEPDVVQAGGLELLDEFLSKVASLLNPEAEKYGLRFPKGMILWGPPGTGKSLSAKLAAKKMGVPLLAADWGAIIGSLKPDLALRELLELAQALSPTILYWDDFDKGFAGWNSNTDGGVSRRLSGKLLTWMQEVQQPIYMVATVNRLGMLPPELIRRFDDIFFVDLPHEGAMYDIFNLHLQKYFPEFHNSFQSPWTDEEWRILLRDYRLCTPAEIGNAVKKCAEEIYYRNYQQGKQPEQLKITLEDLRQQRDQFTPALIRDEEQILAIRNQATYARPVAGVDVSKFAIPPQELFG
jgi:hypothetical protein